MSDLDVQIAANYRAIEERIERAALRSGRPAAAVSIVAVSKKQPLDRVQALLNCGLPGVVLGENYVQEYKKKLPGLQGQFSSHLIGPLQKNKAKDAVQLFDVIESVHTPAIAQAISHEAAKLKKLQYIFLQVNVSDDDAKSGFAPAHVPDFVRSLKSLSWVSLQGLMTITRQYEDPENARPDFAKLRRLRDILLTDAECRVHIHSDPMQLSMGMSADFEIAVEEGATCVRIGTSLFGQRL